MVIYSNNASQASIDVEFEGTKNNRYFLVIKSQIGRKYGSYPHNSDRSYEYYI